MIKRRSFIKRSVLGLTALIASGDENLKAEPSITVSMDDDPVKKDWQHDPEWVRVKFGDWGGPGVSSKKGPMDNILLKDWAPRSSVITEETFVPKAKYPAIDSHVHLLAKTPEEIADWVKTMDEVGMETSVVLAHPAIGSEFEERVKSLKKAYPGRFQLYCGADFTNHEKSDYPKRVVENLERCHEMGAVGVGEILDKGTGFTRDANTPPNKRLHVDDERLDLFWEKCAELKMPISLHIADHPSAWTPLDVFQERTPDYQHFSQYNMNVPSFDEMIEKRNKVLHKHPKTIFIACHLGNQGHNLEALSRDMDRYPNLYLDTSARDYELGRTPRSSARFLNKYKDRIVFGTDQGREKNMYQIHWRLLETADDYIPGRVGWRYYGLELPNTTLKAIYRDTAKKLFNI